MIWRLLVWLGFTVDELSRREAADLLLGVQPYGAREGEAADNVLITVTRDKAGAIDVHWRRTP